MVRMRVALPLLVGLVGLFGLSGCERSSSTTEADTPGPPTLTVGHVGHDHQLALYAAALAGDALAPGSNVWLREVKSREMYELVRAGEVVARLRLLTVGGGSKMPAAMERGEIDIGFGSTPAVAMFADKGGPLKIICPLQADGDMLVMRADSPVSDWDAFVEACRADGPPLRIGYKAPAAVAKLVFAGALRAEGIPFTDAGVVEADRVILMNMGGGAKAIPLLAAGQIDGFVMNQPTVAMAVHKGLGHVVAELRDLPPEGQWVDHPCCCIAATESTLDAHGEVVKAFLKTILLATERIGADPAFAVDVATEWIRTPRPVEAASIPTVTYLGEPTDRWLAGMVTWLELMQEAKGFTGAYATIAPADFIADVCSLDLCRQAADELRATGMLGARGD